MHQSFVNAAIYIFWAVKFSFSQWIFRIFNVVQKDFWPVNVSFQILFLGMFIKI